MSPSSSRWSFEVASNNKELQRRAFLTGLGTAATSLAGCTEILSRDQPSQPAETPTSTPTESPTQTDSPTPTEPPAYSADNLEEASHLLEDGATLNLIPVDDQQPESVVFDQYNGELDVELNLNEAINQHHEYDSSRASPVVQEFVENVDDPEWRQQILEEHGSEEVPIHWDVYTDESRNFGERMRDSNIWGLWYAFEVVRMGGVSSTNHELKAAAFQGTEQKAGFDTLTWGYEIPGHGLISAIENPARIEDDAEAQETYIIETDFGDGQQVVAWDNSNYSEDKEKHPARRDVDWGGNDGEQERRGFYKGTSIRLADDYFEVGEELTDRFIEFYRNPESEPAYQHLDPATTAAYIARENGGEVSLTEDSIEYALAQSD